MHVQNVSKIFVGNCKVGLVINTYVCSVSVPLEIPMNFRIDPEKEVTDTTSDFLWDSVNTGPWRMQGFFRGYKVSPVLHVYTLYSLLPACYIQHRMRKMSCNVFHINS